MTVGGAMFGYCAIGSTGSATRPKSRITSEQTAAKIGRRRKKSTTKVGTSLRSAGLLAERVAQTEFCGEPAVQRGDLADDLPGHAAHRDPRVRGERGAGIRLEQVQRLEQRQRRGRRRAAAAVEDFEGQAQPRVEQRVAVDRLRAGL